MATVKCCDQSGMICSGEQTIFLYPVKLEDRQALTDLTRSLQENRNGTLELSPGGIRFFTDPPSVNFFFEKTGENNFLLREKTGYKNVLHIIGGGHCSLALSRLMCTMDFYIHLYEERENLNTLSENIYAHEKHILGSYAELNEKITPGNHVYVVIMTVGYRTDEIAVRALADAEFRYLGVLGSKTKMKKMFGESLPDMQNNFLQKISTPAGLSIKSQTPEEIAVSIAAEIIQAKNRDQ